MNGLLKVQDTKYPNKDPFEISQAGFDGLQKQFPDRYRSVDIILVTPEQIQVTKKEVATPAKATKGK